MALRTLGTNANNSFTAMLAGTDDINNPTNLAILLNGILNDIPMVNQALQSGQPRNRLIGQPYIQGSWGTLYVPNRGYLTVKPGDFVAFDPTTGWPILISADCAANGAVTHT
jgi:hypothetical protein